MVYYFLAKKIKRDRDTNVFLEITKNLNDQSFNYLCTQNYSDFNQTKNLSFV